MEELKAMILFEAEKESLNGIDAALLEYETKREKTELVKYKYGVALIQSPEPMHKEKGLAALEDVVHGNDDDLSRAALYFLAFGYFKLKQYKEVVTVTEKAMNDNVATLQLQALHELATEMMTKKRFGSIRGNPFKKLSGMLGRKDDLNEENKPKDKKKTIKMQPKSKRSKDVSQGKDIAFPGFLNTELDQEYEENSFWEPPKSPTKNDDSATTVNDEPSTTSPSVPNYRTTIDNNPSVASTTPINPEFSTSSRVSNNSPSESGLDPLYSPPHSQTSSESSREIDHRSEITPLPQQSNIQKRPSAVVDPPREPLSSSGQDSVEVYFSSEHLLDPVDQGVFDHALSETISELCGEDPPENNVVSIIDEFIDEFLNPQNPPTIPLMINASNSDENELKLSESPSKPISSPPSTQSMSSTSASTTSPADMNSNSSTSTSPTTSSPISPHHSPSSIRGSGNSTRPPSRLGPRPGKSSSRDSTDSSFNMGTQSHIFDETPHSTSPLSGGSSTANPDQSVQPTNLFLEVDDLISGILNDHFS